MPKFAPSGEDEIRRILEAACFNRELLILTLPDQRYESHFIHLDAGALHVAPSMSGEDVLHKLRTADLGLRFPAGSRFLEGRTRLLGHGMAQGRRTLRMAIPEALQDDELRRGHRVTRPGRVEVSFRTARSGVRTGMLMDISTGGLRLQAPGLDLEAELGLDEAVELAVPLERTLRIEAKGVVRWVAGRNAGLEFEPALERATLASLARWVFQRREEDRQQPALGPAAGGGALLLVSADPGLEAPLRSALGDLGTLERTGGGLPELREALGRNPAVVLFHVLDSGLEDRARLRALAEAVEGRCPALLLGTDLEPARLFTLAGELKLQYSFGFRPNLGPFLNRLVGGLIRREAAPSPVEGSAP